MERGRGVSECDYHGSNPAHVCFRSEKVIDGCVVNFIGRFDDSEARSAGYQVIVVDGSHKAGGRGETVKCICTKEESMIAREGEIYMFKLEK
jgi:hypothetical protein